jgi:hypothetical protein
MFRKLSGFFSQNVSPARLSEVDFLYRETVSQLPKCVRSAYCESLIHRCRFDLKCTVCVHKKKSLTQLMMAAQREMQNLSQR